MKLATLLLAASSLCAQVPGIIFDTDMGNDIDDALALAMLHSLETKGECRLLAVTLTKDSPSAAPYCDLMNHFYKRPQIPIGVVKNGKTPEDTPMIQVPVERRDSAGKLLYPRRIQKREDAADAVSVIRNVLSAQPDGSVVVVQVGFSTNFARLLSEPGGKELIAKKVKLLSVMAGAFPGKPEYNVKEDIPAAKKLFAEWPTPVVASGFEIGKALLYPASSIEKDYGYVPAHPVADAYRVYMKMPYDRPTWDLTSVLYGVRPNAGYFNLSPEGRITVKDDGVTDFTVTRGGPHRFLILDPIKQKRIIADLISLASQPPR
jgi:inosine-uridine nucleoside N-ribohydrolase